MDPFDVQTEEKLLQSKRLASLGNYWGPIEGSPETPCITKHYRIEGFKGALNRTIIMPRDAIVSRRAKEH